MKTLLLDLTSLDTPSRRRGPGRYVRELALGLSRLSGADLGGVRLLGLTRLGFDGSCRVTEDLASFTGSPELSLPTSRDYYRWAYARRIGLFRAVRHIGCDAVHFGDPHSTPLLWGLTDCKKILTCHDMIPVRFRERYMSWRDGGPIVGTAIERRRYRNADLIVAISDETKRDVVRLLGAKPERVVRVYNGIDVERWSTLPTLDTGETLERFGLRSSKFALYVGGYHWHKNVEGMIGGLARARARGEDIELVWAGQLSPEHAELVLAEARRAGVGGAVRTIGYVPDDALAVLYRAALAHVLVSRAEGFGLTPVEAMASGCPVVTNRTGALSEVAGDAALTVDPEDHAAIGDALVRLSVEPALRASLIEKGRRRAPLFSLAVQATAMAGAYRTFLGV